MILQSPLSTVTPTVDGDVLGILARADDWFTVTRLVSLIGNRSPEGIRNALTRLQREGVVDVQPAGRAYLYRLNRDHLAAPAIIALASLREALFDRLRSEFDRWPIPPAYAAVFGSAARGEMTGESDIDLFLLRPDDTDDEWDERADDLAHRASRWTGGDVRILQFLRGEARGSALAEPVLGDIARDGITLFGDRASFRRLVGAR